VYCDERESKKWLQKTGKRIKDEKIGRSAFFVAPVRCSADCAWCFVGEIIFFLNKFCHFDLKGGLFF